MEGSAFDDIEDLKVLQRQARPGAVSALVILSMLACTCGDFPAEDDTSILLL
jgi:hypothetical protein